MCIHNILALIVIERERARFRSRSSVASYICHWSFFVVRFTQVERSITRKSYNRRFFILHNKQYKSKIKALGLLCTKKKYAAQFVFLFIIINFISKHSLSQIDLMILWNQKKTSSIEWQTIGFCFRSWNCDGNFLPWRKLFVFFCITKSPKLYFRFINQIVDT